MVISYTSLLTVTYNNIVEYLSASLRLSVRFPVSLEHGMDDKEKINAT